MKDEIRIDLHEQLYAEGLVEAKRERLIRNGYEMHIDMSNYDWIFKKCELPPK